MKMRWSGGQAPLTKIIPLKIMKNRLVFMTKESLILKNNHLEINSYLITTHFNKI